MAADSQQNEKEQPQRTVLVVDDDPQMREVLETALGERDYEVVTAESAERALEILQDRKIMMHLLDLQLPGMNGIELCRRIREFNPVAIKYAMTGYVSVFHLVECREVGFDDYFVKPFKMELMIQRVGQAFEKLERWRRGK
jgi:CheY-like chemotaxis protein